MENNSYFKYLGEKIGIIKPEEVEHYANCESHEGKPCNCHKSNLKKYL